MHGYGYLAGAGTGSPGVTPGLPLRFPTWRERVSRIIVYLYDARQLPMRVSRLDAFTHTVLYPSLTFHFRQCTPYGSESS
jgi:hypothetical protein